MNLSTKIDSWNIASGTATPAVYTPTGIRVAGKGDAIDDFPAGIYKIGGRKIGIK